MRTSPARTAFLAVILVSLVLVGFARQVVSAQADPDEATAVEGQVILNGSVILDVATDAPGCNDVGAILYAPDGQNFAALLNCIEGDNEAFVFSADGVQKRRITGADDFVDFDKMSWSSDGASLYYQRVNAFGGGPSDEGRPVAGLVRYALADGAKTVLLAHLPARRVTWSLDDQFAAFYTIDTDVARTHLFVLKADGAYLWELDLLDSADEEATLEWQADEGASLTLTYGSQVVTPVVYTMDQSDVSPGSGWRTVASVALAYVVGLAEDDSLAIRAGRGANSSTVGQIPPDAADITLLGQSVRIGGAIWVTVDYHGVQGWANRRFLRPVLPQANIEQIITPAYLQVIAGIG